MVTEYQRHVVATLALLGLRPDLFTKDEAAAIMKLGQIAIRKIATARRLAQSLDDSSSLPHRTARYH